MRFGLPQVITSDCASEFNNSLDSGLAKLLNIKIRCLFRSQILESSKGKEIMSSCSFEFQSSLSESDVDSEDFSIGYVAKNLKLF